MTKLPDYKVNDQLEWMLLSLSRSPFHLLKYSLLILQPYPMYPATTSLVNVVPKLSSTGRDLLQVTSAHMNRIRADFSMLVLILLLITFSTQCFHAHTETSIFMPLLA